MEILTLNEALRNMYNNEIAFIKETNNELEREFFSNENNVPLGEINRGLSFEDNFEEFKQSIKHANEDKIEEIFLLLREYFLFSYGHDLMFKKKLEADLFTSAPMEDFLYPKLEEAVRGKYNDVSVMQENPNFEKNIYGISKILRSYIDMQSLLYLLYWNDFQFPNGWEGLCEDDPQVIIDALNNANVTIGDFLKALIDEKCRIMKKVLDEIEDKKLRAKYLKQLEELKEEKKKEVEGFAHSDLPVTYFLDHTVIDFLRTEKKSKLLSDDKPKVAQKLYIPNN